MSFSPQQQHVLDSIKTRINENKGGVIFLTGEAGTGKSYVMKEACSRHAIVKLGTTGLAAMIQGGVTVHSFISAGTDAILKPCGTWDSSSMKRMLKENADVLRKAQAILVDEAFMLRAEIVDLMDHKFKREMMNSRPFGGKLMIFCGDPWQIEPVVAAQSEREMLQHHYNGNPFLWNSKAIKEMGMANVERFELTEVFRQSGDPAFAAALNGLRVGKVSPLDMLNKRVKPWDKECVVITFTNARAAAINDLHMGMIKEQGRTYYADNRSGINPKNQPAPERLELKPGARIIMRANTDSFVNGDTGVVTGLEEECVTVKLDRMDYEINVHPHEWEVRKYSFDDSEGFKSKVVASYSQLPIILGWAITGHKSQGQTYEKAHIEMESRPHSCGLFYVAVSRVKSLEGLSLGRAARPSDVMTSEHVHAWARELRREAA